MTEDIVYREGSGPGKSHGAKHGTLTAYGYGCRCHKCKLAVKNNKALAVKWTRDELVSIYADERRGLRFDMFAREFMSSRERARLAEVKEGIHGTGEVRRARRVLEQERREEVIRNMKLG